MRLSHQQPRPDPWGAFVTADHSVHRRVPWEIMPAPQQSTAITLPYSAITPRTSPLVERHLTSLPHTSIKPRPQALGIKQRVKLPQTKMSPTTHSLKMRVKGAMTVMVNDATITLSGDFAPVVGFNSSLVKLI